MLLKNLFKPLIFLIIFLSTSCPAAPLSVEFIEQLCTFLYESTAETTIKRLTDKPSLGGASAKKSDNRLVVFKKESGEYSPEEKRAIESIQKIKVALNLYLQGNHFNDKKSFLIGLYSGINNTQLRKAYLLALGQPQTFPIEKNAQDLYCLLLQALNEGPNDRCLSLITFISGFLEGIELAKQYDDEIRFTATTTAETLQNKFDSFYQLYLCNPMVISENHESLRTRLAITDNQGGTTFFNGEAIAGQSSLDLVTSMQETSVTTESLQEKRATRWTYALYSFAESAARRARAITAGSSHLLADAPSGGAGSGAGSFENSFDKTALVKLPADPYGEDILYARTKFTKDQPIFVVGYGYSLMRPTRPLANNTFDEACKRYIQGIKTHGIDYLARHDGLAEGAKYYLSPFYLKQKYEDFYKKGYFCTCLEDVEVAFAKSNVTHPEDIIDIESLMFLRGFIAKTVRKYPEYNNLTTRPATEEIPEIINYLRHQPTPTPISIAMQGAPKPKKKKRSKKTTPKKVASQEEINAAEACAKELLLIEEGEKAARLEQEQLEQKRKQIQEEHNRRQRQATLKMYKPPLVTSPTTEHDSEAEKSLLEAAAQAHQESVASREAQNRALQEIIAIIEQRNKEHAAAEELRKKKLADLHERRLASFDGAPEAAEGKSEETHSGHVKPVIPEPKTNTAIQRILEMLQRKKSDPGAQATDAEGACHERPWLYLNPFVSGLTYGEEELTSCIMTDLYIYFQKRSVAQNTQSQWARSQTPEAQAAALYWSGVIHGYEKLINHIIRSFNSGRERGFEKKLIASPATEHTKKNLESIIKTIECQPPSCKSIGQYYHYKGILKAYNTQDEEDFQQVLSINEIALILEERPPVTYQPRRDHSIDYHASAREPATTSAATTHFHASSDIHGATTPSALVFYTPIPHYILKHHFDIGFMAGQKALARALFENPYAYKHFAHTANQSLYHLTHTGPLNIYAIKEWEGFLAGCYDLESRCRIISQNGFITGYKSPEHEAGENNLESYTIDLRSREGYIHGMIQASFITGIQAFITPEMIIDLFYKRQFIAGYQQALQEKSTPSVTHLLVPETEMSQLEYVMNTPLETLLLDESNESVGRGFYNAANLLSESFFENRDTHQELKERAERSLVAEMRSETRNTKHLLFYQGFLKGLQSRFELLKEAIQSGTAFCNDSSIEESEKAATITYLQEKIADIKRAIEASPEAVTHEMLEELDHEQYFIKAYELTHAENTLQREIEQIPLDKFETAERSAAPLETATERCPAGAGCGAVEEDTRVEATDYGYAQNLTTVRELQQAAIDKEIAERLKKEELSRLLAIKQHVKENHGSIVEELLTHRHICISTLQAETLVETQDLRWKLIQALDKILNEEKRTYDVETKTAINKRLGHLASSFTLGINKAYETTGSIDHTMTSIKAQNYLKNFSMVLDHKDCTEPLKALSLLFEYHGYLHGTKHKGMKQSKAYEPKDKREKKTPSSRVKTAHEVMNLEKQMLMKTLLEAAEANRL